MVTENLASKLCSLLLLDPQDIAREWRLLGQEQDGTLLFTWIQYGGDSDPRSKIGLYIANGLNVIHSFQKSVNVIQASINLKRNLLAYVTKEGEGDRFIYNAHLVKFNEDGTYSDCNLELNRPKQVMVQFLYQKQSILSENQPDKLLVLIHEESVRQYQIGREQFHLESFPSETIVKVFIWAQWDCLNQTLYYIHFRKLTRSLVEGEETEPSKRNADTPTLSGLQFHDDLLPHETVLNIPLNLPHLSTTPSSCNTYEDDTVPLRVHNCSLDLMVVTDEKGYVCVCHHYLYQPIQPPEKLEENDTRPVHFAYSVTVLHHSCVIHCVVPGIPWNQAKTIRPYFKLYDDHMLIFIPGICTHLLDIGAMHEPCCHITTTADIEGLGTDQLCLAPLYKYGRHSVLNITNLDVLNLYISPQQLVQTFKGDTTLRNRLSILHHLILHQGEVEIAGELISGQVEKFISMDFSQLLREFLIASSLAIVQRNLPSDAQQLVNLLPLTTQVLNGEEEVRVGPHVISLSQDILWNASMMLLSPQQRVVPYRSDIWVKLWDHLSRFAKNKQRFKPGQVVEKLLVSLICYQPEALSRSSTPLSPGGALGSSTVLPDLSSCTGQSSRKSYIDSLPFYEIESCTASRQEHIISVNLRELSMHLLKQSTENKMSCFQWHSQTPMHVHAVATRYVSAQLEQSRCLCQILCKTATVEPKYEHEKGFIFIDQLSEEKRYVLFSVLERYYFTVESIGFPFPQGFSSFFTFLGYRTLRFPLFLQYVNRNVFELQIDVMKIIMADIEDSKEGVQRKLKLLSLLPKTRAKRLLNQWNHPISLMFRAREHATDILSGVEGINPKTHRTLKSKHHKLGIAAFPSGDRLSPLDTFLDLLTAKASLAELDFGLLIEATVSSTEEFI